MKKTLLLFCFMLLSFLSPAQTIFGLWEVSDGTSNTVDSLVEIYEKEGKAYAKVVRIMDTNKQHVRCTKCTGKRENQRILGMNILTGLKKDGNEWSGGQILDPKNGKTYKCYIKLTGNNTLKIRGYIGISLFGRTEFWQRKKN